MSWTNEHGDNGRMVRLARSIGLVALLGAPAGRSALEASDAGVGQELVREASPGEPGEGDRALVEARARFERGELREAAARLAVVEGKLGELEAHGAKLRGEALLLSGEPVGAVGALRRALALGADGPVARSAAALLADALLDSGDARAAAAQAERAAALASQPPTVRAALAWTRVSALAQLARETSSGAESGAATRGAAKLALEAARAFWLEHPEHPAVGGEPALEQELAALAQVPLEPPSSDELLYRAERLLADGQPSLAVDEARRARDQLRGPPRADASLLLARALAADGRRSEAGPALSEATHSRQPHVIAQALLLLSRDRLRSGDKPAARALAQQLRSRFPSSGEAADAALFLARTEIEAGRPEAARKIYARLAARGGAGSQDARWAIAWLSFEQHRRDSAEQFAAAAASAPDDATRARATYWQARSLAGTKSIPLFERTRQFDPLGWYGLLARQALAGPRAADRSGAGASSSMDSGTTPPFPSPTGATLLESHLTALPGMVRHLLRIGFLPEAAAALDAAVAHHRGDAEAMLPLLAGFQAAHRFDRSVPLAQTLLQGHPAALEFREPGRAAQGAADPTLRALLQAAYPAAFPDEFAASGARSGLDPYLLLAVARRESLFRPDVRSAAGAVGLLQLLPITARRAATVLGRPSPSELELVEPSVAIDLGSYYLAELVGRFGDPAVAIAAYNAGPRAVAKWAAPARGAPLDVWVEEIPFKETRQYVKIVIGAWSAYRILAGGEPPQLARTVPEVGNGTSF